MIDQINERLAPLRYAAEAAKRSIVFLPRPGSVREVDVMLGFVTRKHTGDDDKTLQVKQKFFLVTHSHTQYSTRIVVLPAGGRCSSTLPAIPDSRPS